MAIKPVVVDKRSPFLGEACALCKQPLSPGDELAICPEDATRHHAHCWRANGNKCTAYGCTGHGELLEFSTAGATILRRGEAGSQAGSNFTCQELPLCSKLLDCSDRCGDNPLCYWLFWPLGYRRLRDDRCLRLVLSRSPSRLNSLLQRDFFNIRLFVETVLKSSSWTIVRRFCQ